MHMPDRKGFLICAVLAAVTVSCAPQERSGDEALRALLQAGDAAESLFLSADTVSAAQASLDEALERYCIRDPEVRLTLASGLSDWSLTVPPSESRNCVPESDDTLRRIFPFPERVLLSGDIRLAAASDLSAYLEGAVLTREEAARLNAGIADGGLAVSLTGKITVRLDDGRIVPSGHALCMKPAAADGPATGKRH